MTTIDEFSLCLKVKQKCFLNNISENENGDRYSNLNLNQSSKCPILIPVQSCYISNTDKLCGSKASDNCEIKQKLQPWNKSSKISTFPTFNDNNDDLKKRWKNENILNSNNKSTLSLHISAYENSIEADSSHSFENKKNEGFRKLENAKHVFISSTFSIQNPFEFPRQQNDKMPEPEVSHFKATRQLLIPNKETNNLEQKSVALTNENVETKEEVLDDKTTTTETTETNEQDSNNEIKNLIENVSDKQRQLINGYCEKKLSQKVAAKLAEVVIKLEINEDDFDNRAIDLLSTFTEDQSMFIMEEIEKSQLYGVQNRAQYLMSLMKNFKDRVRTMSSNATSMPLIPGPNVEDIKAIIERTGYQMEITVGQRKYHSPPGNIPEPVGSDHEIFIGQIPFYIFEDILIPLFESIGKIWDFRIMMDPINGKSHGYAFLVYVDKAHAAEAAKKFNGYEISPGKTLKVNVSVANTRLFVGNIPKSKTKEEILNELKKHAEGINDVIVYTYDSQRNRGFCFVDFIDHKSASDAKRRMGLAKLRPWNSDLFIEWADQQNEPDKEIMSKVKAVYVKNLKESVTEEKLKEIFGVYGEIDSTTKIRDYAFIRYKERDSAIKAVEGMKNQQIDGINVIVEFAKPYVENKQKRQKPVRIPKRNHKRSPSNRSQPIGPYGNYYYNGPVGIRGGSAGGGYYSAPSGFGAIYPAAATSYADYIDPYAGYGAPYQPHPAYSYNGYDLYSSYSLDPYYTGPYTEPARGTAIGSYTGPSRGRSTGPYAGLARGGATGVGDFGGNFNGGGGGRGGRSRCNGHKHGRNRGGGGRGGSKRRGEGYGGPASKRGGGRTFDFSADTF